ncbi:MAG TPA: hypothetical protein VFM49_13430 [Chloroflexia bacterium]|nr:hypothetical protein [Chloroflexia bacterium]
MWFALNLRQEVAYVLVAAFQQGRPALSEMDLAEALEQRGLVVEYRTVTAILEGLETRGCVRLSRAGDDVVVAEIYPAIAHFLSGAPDSLPVEAAPRPAGPAGGFTAPPTPGGPWTWR